MIIVEVFERGASHRVGRVQAMARTEIRGWAPQGSSTWAMLDPSSRL
jgi:hypothetical protein